MTIHMVCRDNRTSPVSVVILVDVPTSQAEKRVAVEGQAAGSGLSLSHLCVAAQRGGESCTGCRVRKWQEKFG